MRPQPHRYRVNVPQADEAVIAWMAVQDNTSQSLRLLIRENIERHGYIDVMNRPVDQLPKRGRPAVSDEEPAARPEPPAAAPALHLVPPAEPPLFPLRCPLTWISRRTRQPLLNVLGIALESPVLAQGLQAPAAQPVAPAVPVPAPSIPEPPAGGQVDVNDIFSSIR